MLAVLKSPEGRCQQRFLFSVFNTDTTEYTGCGVDSGQVEPMAPRRGALIIGRRFSAGT